MENLVEKSEINIEVQRNLAAAAEYNKKREALQRERDEQIERSRADARGVVKFGLDVTLTVFSAGVGGLSGAGISIAYSAATSDDPVKGGAVQAVIEVATPSIVKIVPGSSGVLREAAVNLALTKTEEATEDSLGEVLERQRQRDRIGGRRLDNQ